MNKKNEESNSVEMITFVGGCTILIALFAYLTYQLVDHKETPPQLEITSHYEPSMDNYAFRIHVANRGATTVEGAHINLELFQAGRVAATGILQMKYVPSESRETGWVVFSRERKASDSLVVSSVTFVKP